MRRFPPGERKINYTHIIKEKRRKVKGNGSRERETFLRSSRGEMREMRERGKWGKWGKWGKFVAFLSIIRFGKLAKSRAIDGCTPAPFLRWYNVSRGTWETHDQHHHSYPMLTTRLPIANSLLPYLSYPMLTVSIVFLFQITNAVPIKHFFFSFYSVNTNKPTHYKHNYTYKLSVYFMHNYTVFA